MLTLSVEFNTTYFVGQKLTFGTVCTLGLFWEFVC